MACLKCADLEQLFGSKLSKYSEARSAMFHQVSTELAARKQVDMERARNDLEEHQLVCPMSTSDSSHPQVVSSRGRSLQLQLDKAWS
jgi:cytidylate kinase